MSQPLASDRHVSTPLTSISIAYTQDPSDFVARRVFPIVPSAKQYDLFYVFGQAELLRSQMTIRDPGTESNEGVYTLSNSPFLCKVLALHKKIADEDRANADSVFALDAEATKFLTDQALLKEEIDFATNYMAASVWGTTINGVASGPVAGTSVLRWSDGASTPIEDIRAGKQAIKLATAQRANVLVLSEPVWNQLADHPDFLARIKGGSTSSMPAIVLRQLLAQILELEEVLVMGGIQNTADKGQTASTSFIGGKGALLCHRPSTAARMTPSAGYTFAWTGFIGGTSPTAIYRFREDLKHSDRIEIQSAYVQQITGASLGYYFNDIVA